MDERRALWTRDGRERRRFQTDGFQKCLTLDLVPLELDTWLMDYICCWPLLSSFSCLGPFARANTFYISSIHTASCCTSPCPWVPALLSTFIHSGVLPLLLGANQNPSIDIFIWYHSLFFFFLSPFSFFGFINLHIYICARPLATYLSTPRYLSVACFFLRIIPLVLCITPFGVAIKSDCQSNYRLRAKCATTAARATIRARSRSIEWRWRHRDHVIEAFAASFAALLAWQLMLPLASAQQANAPWATVERTDRLWVYNAATGPSHTHFSIACENRAN